MSDALELRAWRFLAAHRVGKLAVTHVEFIDGDHPTVVTPSTGQHYDSATGATFGDAAIELAQQLGMDGPCPEASEEFETLPAPSDQGSSSVLTATLPSGANEQSSPRTVTESADWTTGAIGAEPSTETALDKGQPDNS